MLDGVQQGDILSLVYTSGTTGIGVGESRTRHIQTSIIQNVRWSSICGYCAQAHGICQAHVIRRFTGLQASWAVLSSPHVSPALCSPPPSLLVTLRPAQSGHHQAPAHLPYVGGLRAHVPHHLQGSDLLHPAPLPLRRYAHKGQTPRTNKNAKPTYTQKRRPHRYTDNPQM